MLYAQSRSVKAKMCQNTRGNIPREEAKANSRKQSFRDTGARKQKRDGTQQRTAEQEG